MELTIINLKKKIQISANEDTCIKTFKTEEQHVKVVFVPNGNPLATLAKILKKNFLSHESLLASYEKDRYAFQNATDGLLSVENELFTDFTVSVKMK